VLTQATLQNLSYPPSTGLGKSLILL